MLWTLILHNSDFDSINLDWIAGLDFVNGADFDELIGVVIDVSASWRSWCLADGYSGSRDNNTYGVDVCLLDVDERTLQE